jgi:hypothetical protein
VRGGNGDLGDVRAEVEDEGVEAGAEADGGGDAEDDPVGDEVEQVLDGLRVRRTT